MPHRKMSRQVKRFIVRANMSFIVPLTVVGGIWAYLITYNVGAGLVVSLFLLFFSLLHTYVIRLDNVWNNLFGKRIPFITLQLIRLSIEIISTFVIICIYLYFKEGYIVFSHVDASRFMLILYFAVTVGIIINQTTILQRMVGHSMLKKYVRGKYHEPREEEHIFMFIDLKDSTTIAETIGHTRFFSLINDLLNDIEDAVISNKGEIYKFVGDEVIITWTKKKGIKKNRCLKLFFDYKQLLIDNQDKYLKEYGVTPHFKAGVHVGKVIVGEMGSLRTEIAYMGDTVNTAARIEGECKKHQAELLISKDLFDLLPQTTGFQFETLNRLRLKGKLTDIQLVRVSKTE